MAPFDPYHIWLGIPETERPISKYRLLGITDFENNREVISSAAERQTIYLRTLQAGEHEVLVAELLNEVSQARVALLNADQKAEYDEGLRELQAPEPVPEPTPPPIPVVQTPSPTPVVVRGTVTQEYPVSVVQPAKRPRRMKRQEIWKRPAVIGATVVGVIGVFVLLISLMSSGDTEPVATNSTPVVASPLIPSPESAPAQATANTLPASLQEGLVAYYPFNGNAQDESGNGNDGVIYGARLAADRHMHQKKAFAFKHEHYIELPPKLLSQEETLSISAWCKPAFTNGQKWPRIVGGTGDETSKNISINIDQRVADQRKRFLFELETEAGTIKAESPEVPAERWIHVAMVSDGQSLTCFLNGKRVAKKTVIGTLATMKTLSVGAENFNFHYEGDIDDIRIYNRALSAAEVKALYEYESKPPASPIPTAPAIDSITNTIGMKLNLIPAGSFLMGSPEDEADRHDDEHQHGVSISKAFYMQTTEVTQGQWKAVMGTEPWKGQRYAKAGPNYAASYVSWNGAVAYCKTLSEKEGKTYRLPTEAEWEYACRAGTEARWSFGNDEKALGDYAWYKDNAFNIGEKYAHQVGLKKPNTFGLYDMHGNVWEWSHDYYEEDYYQQSPTNDPKGPTSGSSRVLRGGSWSLYTRNTRSADRDRFGDDSRNYFSGFRLVRELD